MMRTFIKKVYADPEFKKFMKGMGMEAWGAGEKDILKNIDE